MSLGQVCIRRVDLAEADETVQMAARRMFDRRTGILVVCDEHNRPVGMITDRDLAIRVVGAGRSHSTLVEKVMTSSPACLAENATLEEALALMRSGPYRQLMVVDKAGRLAGLITLDDILELLTEEFREIGELLERESPASANELAPSTDEVAATTEQRAPNPNR